LKIGPTSETENENLSSATKSNWLTEPRSQAAVRRMEIDPSALEKMPPISDILDEAGIAKTQVIKAMRFSDDPLVVQFFDSYDALPLMDRELVPLEALILKAGINPVHFLGSMQLAIRENSMNRTKMIAMVNHPEIMQKTVEFAKISGGYRDREHLYTMTGALPTTKGVSIFQKFTNVMPEGAKSEEVQEAEVLETDANYIFPDSSKTQERLSPIRQKMLESGR
jgi:hypothetical protein